MVFLRHRISVGAVCRCFTFLFIILGFSVIQAQDPIGAPDEVWVTSSVGETLYVGQEVAFHVYVANSQSLGGFSLKARMRADGGGAFQTVPQPDSFQWWPDFMIPNLESRFWGDDFDHLYSEFYKTHDTLLVFGVLAHSLVAPHVSAGPLAQAFDIHIMPTSAGTIAIDSFGYPPAGEGVSFTTVLGDDYVPAWNGPFEFTVLEAPPGDVNGDGVANVGDVVYLISWIFRGGPPPRR